MAEIHPMEHKLTEALKGQTTQGPLGVPADHGHAGGPNEDPAHVAEQARREHKADHHGVPTRDERMVDIGRGENIAGRQTKGDRS